MKEQKNFIIAIALSMAVLLGWQYFVGVPIYDEEERVRQKTAQAEREFQSATLPEANVVPQDGTGSQLPQPDGIASKAVPQAYGAVPVPGGTISEAMRDEALSTTKRIEIDTPNLQGSISLKGLRLDDLKIIQYHETVDPESPFITLLSPVGSPYPYYVEHGWTVAPGTTISVPNSSSIWQIESGSRLEPERPVTFIWDNGAGLIFRRTITADALYMFNVSQTVKNNSGSEVTLYPYALVSRHGTPEEVAGFYILHEGLVGVMGEEGLQEFDYDDVTDDNTETFSQTGGWLGITDKYWAAVVAPDQSVPYKARFTSYGNEPIFQTDFLSTAVTIAPGRSETVTSQTFAGAKQVSAVDGYEAQYGLLNFDLLVDWGWFYFATKPMFLLLDWLNGMVGNFGVGILIATVLIKLVFFPLANKAYASMSAMKKLQPDVAKLRERYKDDKMKQQQEMMALYKKEKVNPMAGCLPIIIQIPVFFALYKVLFVTIEMRHQPFFGWIQDLSAPDPTSLFNLFGLIPWDPPNLLMIGVWPLIMGFTMFLQMRLNPSPPDPIQAQIFNWMPLFFTFLLAQFAAGLVIYWAWNNSLSVLQQYVIMKRMGVKVELWDNITGLFSAIRSKKSGKTDGGSAPS
jgi:YidC/Oxa1 family membrane protein insertase